MTQAREPGRAGRVSRALTWRALPWTIGVVGVVAGVVMALGVPVLGLGTDDWSKDAKAAEAAATDFVVTFNTYSADALDDYRSRVSGLVTDDFNEVFLQQLADAEANLTASQVAFSDVVVTSKGLVQRDGDTASVVVTFTLAVDSATTEPVTLASRVIVDVTKSGSTWLASDMTEIAPVDASATDPGATPSPTPTPEATP